jgi:glycosyltransferase involved in cell wall biosynthesis
MAVIPQLGVDPQRFHPDSRARAAMRLRIGAAPDDFVIGYAGRLVREKGVHLLIESARELPNAQVMIIGHGPERDALVELAVACGVSERVHFVGALPSLEMPKWLVACDVLVLPTIGRKGWVEQFGRILVEAMACGVAVVGSDSGEIPHVIGDAGVVVPAGNVKGLSEALTQFESAPLMRGMLGERGRARVLSMYTHTCVASATAAYYEQVVGQARVS